MGNLEKLGILVIVILVVVVGVVAITPKSTVDERLMPPDGQSATESAKAPEALEPNAPPAAAGDAKAPQDPWPKSDAAGGQKKLPGTETLAADPASAPSAAAPADSSPTYRTVKVQAGDTPATIAKRELGSAARYQEILKANPGLVASKMKKGQEIRIPVAPAKAGTEEATTQRAPSAPAPASHAAGPALEPAASTASSGSEKTYTVKKGDTLSSIAAREMGSKAKWTELQKANEDVLHGSTGLKIDMKLRIPAGEKSSGTSSSDPAPAASAADTPSGGAAEREYVVKPGDSLWLIAKNELGSEKLVGELRAANADVLNGSDSLKVGTTLKIPAKK
jgi:nucleoid-associated protein YgaU